MGNSQRRKYKWPINMRKCSASLPIKKIPSKTAMRYCFSLIKLAKQKYFVLAKVQWAEHVFTQLMRV